MYNYGLDGDDTLLQEKQYADQINGIREDDDEQSPRGEEHTPLIGSLTSHLLRIGFSLQTGSLLFMFIFYLAFGGSGVFIFDLYAAPENVKISSAFHLTISILTAVYLLGIFYVAMFQVFVADNSKLCRGFRTGSKILSAAVTLDAICTSLRLVQYLYAYFYMSMKWWSRYQQTKADWLLFNTGNVLNAFALCMYGAALFYMEAYHDEGVAEEYAWINLFLFKFAALSELVMVFTGYGAFYSVFMLCASISATLWAFSFESLLERWTPELHSRDINADILPEPKDTSDIGGTEGETGGIEMGGFGGGAGDFDNSNYTATTIPRNSGGLGGGVEGNYGGTVGNADIPTSYDYSQLQQQVSQGVEMGVIN